MDATRETLTRIVPDEGPVDPSSEATLDPVVASRWAALLGAEGSLQVSPPGQTYRPSVECDSEQITLAPAPSSVPGSVTDRAESRDYLVRSLLGQGGMGAVHRAEQVSLRREVAYKRPLRSDPNLVKLFACEAQVTGFLEHPNIVPVHGLGIEEDGRLYFSMKLVSGVPWSDLLHPDEVKDEALRVKLRERTASMGLEGHLRILLSVCHAVAFAHSRQILHRDLKPANVMVGDFGEVLVMDWGLAVESSRSPSPAPRAPHVSRSGLGGTPSYMAPEMATGEAGGLGVWSDIFLLGAILHEILAGHAPYEVTNITHALALATRCDPPTLPGVPEELARICRKAMEKDRDRRYPDVSTFQTTIEEYLEHQKSILITRLAEGELERLRAPNPAFQKSASSHEVLPQVSYELHARVVARFEQALELWPANARASHGLVEARLTFARSALSRGDLGLAMNQVESLGPLDSVGAELAGAIRAATLDRERRARAARTSRWLAIGLGSLVILIILVSSIWIRRERNEAQAQAVRADENAARAETQRGIAEQSMLRGLVLQGDCLGPLRRWSEARGKYRKALEGARSEASVMPEATMGLWGHLYEHTPPVAILSGLEQSVRGTSFSPDGEKVAAAGEDGIAVWDALTRRRLVSVAGAYRCLAWSPSGDFLALGLDDGGLELRRADTGELVRGLGNATSIWNQLCFTPDSTQVVAGGWEKVVQILNVGTGVIEVKLVGHRTRIAALGMSGDGKVILSGASEGTDAEIKRWDRSTGICLDSYEWKTQYCSCGAFTPDGRFALSGAQDAILRILDIDGKAEIAALPGHVGMVRTVACTPDGKQALTGGEDHSLRLWDLAEKRFLRSFGGHEATVRTIAFTRDQTMVATGDESGKVFLWSLVENRGLSRRMAATSSLDPPRMLAIAGTQVPSGSPTSRQLVPARQGAVSPDGRLAAHSVPLSGVELWDVPSGRSLGVLDPTTGPIKTMGFSPDGSRLHVAHSRGILVRWDLATRSIERSWPVTDVTVLDAEGRRAAERRADGRIRVIDLENGTILEGRGPLGLGAMALDRDGRRVMLAREDDPGVERVLVTELDLKSGSLTDRIRGLWVSPESLVLAPDGRHLGCEYVNWSLTGDPHGPVGGRQFRSDVLAFSLPSREAPGPGWMIRTQGALDSLEFVDLENVQEIRTIPLALGFQNPCSPSLDRTGRHLVSFAAPDPYSSGEAPDPPHVLDFEAAHLWLDLEQRAEAATRRLVDEPVDVTSLTTLGRWLLFHGLLDRAIPLLERAHHEAGDGPAGSAARLDLARALRMRGDVSRGDLEQAHQALMKEREVQRRSAATEDRDALLIWLDLCLAEPG